MREKICPLKALKTYNVAAYFFAHMNHLIPHSPRLLSKLTRILCIVLSFTFLTACGSYHPKTTSIARIRAKGDRKGVFHWNLLELMAIEGESVGMPFFEGQFYKVDSGKRAFVVRYQGNRSFGSVLLAAPPIPVYGELKSGHDYEIAGKFTDLAVGLTVREIKTGKFVGPTTVCPLHYERIQTPTYVPIVVPKIQ